ncbi:MAG: ribonuclease P protein component [Thermodesulfobacteriota bacterium]
MGVLSFTRKDRIRKRHEFNEIFQYGKTVEDRYIRIIFAPGATSISRLGTTVSKRVGQAVERNRIKRVLRECFRIHRRLLLGCWDLNIIAKREAAKLTSSDLISSVKTLFRQISERASSNGSSFKSPYSS